MRENFLKNNPRIFWKIIIVSKLRLNSFLKLISNQIDFIDHILERKFFEKCGNSRIFIVSKSRLNSFFKLISNRNFIDQILERKFFEKCCNSRIIISKPQLSSFLKLISKFYSMRDNFLKNNPWIIIVSKLVNWIYTFKYTILFVENVGGFSGCWKRARKEETKRK